MAIELAAGDDRVTVDPERGGRVTSLVAAGTERLVATPPRDVPSELAGLQWGSYVMAPWAGRIRGAVVEWDGRTHQLEPNLDGHAIHGAVFQDVWRTVEQTEDHAVLDCRLDPARWPLGGRVEQTVRTGPGRLAVTITVTAGERSMPAWIGWHSCFRRPEDGDVRVGIAADEVLVTTEDTIPTGERRRVTGDLDLRGTPRLGDRRLDDALIAPTGPLAIRWPDLALDMQVDPPPACAVVFTPAHEFCVEAQTGLPDALRLAREGLDDTGVVALEAGQSVTATNTWTWTETPTQKDST
jgi:aldose 1-epimerase